MAYIKATSSITFHYWAVSKEHSTEEQPGCDYVGLLAGKLVFVSPPISGHFSSVLLL